MNNEERKKKERSEDSSQNQVNLTAYAIIKYIGLIIITIVVLYFIAAFILPFVRDLLR